MAITVAIQLTSTRSSIFAISNIPQPPTHPAQTVPPQPRTLCFSRDSFQRIPAYVAQFAANVAPFTCRYGRGCRNQRVWLDQGELLCGTKLDADGVQKTNGTISSNSLNSTEERASPSTAGVRARHERIVKAEI